MDGLRGVRTEVAVPPVPPAKLWPERYELIDGWRGLAALAVVVNHVAGLRIGGPAVMLFFVISGYCIAVSIDSCRRRKMTFGQFMYRRVKRIYPPYLLSLGFWAATRALKFHQTGVNELARAPHEWLQNFTITQWLTLVPHPLPYAATNPTNFVAAYWSLGYEEQFYLVTGLMMLFASRGRARALGLVLGTLGAALLFNAFFPRLSFGVFLDYWAMFAFGVLVFYRLCRTESRVGRRLIDGGLTAMVVVSAYMAWPRGGAGVAATQFALGGRYVYEESAVAAAFALLLIYSRAAGPILDKMLIYKPFAWLGALTFSLYLVHQFNLVLIARVASKIVGPAAVSAWYGVTLQVTLHIALATVFWFFCERPFLNKTLLTRPDVTSKVAADAAR